jgi:hypothetical protein
MRWNGVFVLGLGLAAIGFVWMAVVKLSGYAPETETRAMGLAISTLACGALVACLGSIMARRQNDPNYLKAPRRRRFEGRASKNGTASRHFGQRAEYSALGKQTAHEATPTETASRPMLGYDGSKRRS